MELLQYIILQDKKYNKWFGKRVARVMHLKDPIGWCLGWMKNYKSWGDNRRYYEYKRMLEIVMKNPRIIKKLEELKELEAFRKELQAKAQRYLREEYGRY